MGALLAFFALLILAAGVSSSAMQISVMKSNKRDRERKMALLEKHPEHAKEILASIEEGDRQAWAKVNQMADDFSQVFQPKAKPKRSSGALRLGLALAKRLVK